MFNPGYSSKNTKDVSSIDEDNKDMKVSSLAYF
jgi:hypothetical protein